MWLVNNASMFYHVNHPTRCPCGSDRISVLRRGWISTVTKIPVLRQTAASQGCKQHGSRLLMVETRGSLTLSPHHRPEERTLANSPCHRCPGCSSFGSGKHSVAFGTTLQPKSHEKMSQRPARTQIQTWRRLRPRFCAQLPALPYHLLDVSSGFSAVFPGNGTGTILRKNTQSIHTTCAFITRGAANRPLSSRLISGRCPWTSTFRLIRTTRAGGTFG